MNNPKLSIITIVKNGENTIEKTIQSVLSQNYSNLEYIIIDGLSTDNTIEIIKKYNITFISEPDLGISDAFNKGLRMCSGEIIGLINSDDYYEPGIFKKIIDNYLLKPDNIICGSLRIFHEDRPDKISFSKPENILKTMSICHPTVFVPKNIYNTYGLFDLNYKISMDYDILLRFYIHGVEFTIIEDIISNMKAGGLSNIFYKKGRNEMKSIKKKYNVKFSYLHEFISIYYHISKQKVRYLATRFGLKKIIFRLIYTNTKNNKFTDKFNS